jgi:hypothetical protein
MLFLFAIGLLVLLGREMESTEGDGKDEKCGW